MAACVDGRPREASSCWQLQELDMGMDIAIEGINDCKDEISALAEHFGIITVDGRRVPSRKR